MTSHSFFVFWPVLVALCGLVNFSAFSAQASAPLRTINIDFGTSNPVSPTFNGVGADADDSGTIWNSVTLDPTSANSILVNSNLLDSVGNTTSTGINVTGITAVSTTTGSNPTTNALLQDYIAGQGKTVTITITNLIPFESYKVYLFGAGTSSGQGATFQIGGISATTNGAARGNTFVQGQNYVVLPTNVDDRGTMTVTVTSNSMTGSPVINGLQIQQNAIPPSISPSFTDAFDVSQGTVIIGGSTTEVGGLEPAIGGRSATSPEPENVLFSFSQPAGTVHYFEFQMPTVKTIQSINIFANYDDYTSAGQPGNINIAGASRMTLWAYNSATKAYDIKAFEIFPANPYTLTLAPPGAAVQNDGAPSLLIVTANIIPVTTDRFRMELVQAGQFGVRFAELDGFTTPNPGLPVSSPVVTTASSTNGQVGAPFFYQLAASNSPTSYSAQNLPAGLSLNTIAGVITGTPITAGTFDAAVSTANGGGQGPVASLRFNITGVGENIQGISVLSPPTNITVTNNGSVEVDAAVLATANTLAQVEFLTIDSANNQTSLAKSTVARSAVVWKPTSTGDFTLQVVATDTSGNQKQISEPIHVVSSIQAGPQINFLSGVNGQQFALGSSIEVVSAATDANGNPLSNVQYFLDGQPVPTTVSTTDAAAFHTDARKGARQRTMDTASAQQVYAIGQVPLTGLEQLLTAIVTDQNGVTTVTPGTKILSVAAPTDPTTFVFSDADGGILSTGTTAPATINVSAINPRRRIAKMELFADSKSLGVVAGGPYSFTLAALAQGQHVLTALATDDSNVSSLSQPVILTSGAMTAAATVTATASGDGMAEEGGKSAKILVQRTGDLSAPLTVFYKVKGSAMPDVDYVSLPGSVIMPVGSSKAKVKIKPIDGSPNNTTLKIKVVLLAPADGSYIVTSSAVKIALVGK